MFVRQLFEPILGVLRGANPDFK